MVAPVAAKAASNIDMTLLLVGAGALLLLGKWGFDEILPEVKAKANIVPESGEFLSGLFRGAKPKYFYELDQSGSPNPPTQDWWEMASDLGATSDWKDRGAGPIRVADGTGVPTSPIIGIHAPSQAERYGGNVRNFFTSGALLKAIDPFPEWEG